MQASQSSTAAQTDSDSSKFAGIADRPAFDDLPRLRVLVLDANAALRRACCDSISQLGFDPIPTAALEEASSALRLRPVDIVVIDPQTAPDAADFLLALKESCPLTELIMMSAAPTVATAIEAMRLGARDFLTKPFASEEFAAVLARTAQRVHFDLHSRRLRERLGTAKGMGCLVGRSAPMQKVYRILSKVALSSHPVLILGESGTGKELVARTIHSSGLMQGRPFFAIDCASTSPASLEAHLFGAGVDPGTLCHPDCTVFLDEIAELPLDVQARLLRAMQEKQITSEPFAQPSSVTARILAASSRDLPAMVSQGRFRRDLYLRLNVVNVKLPPLRERREDIRLLAEFFLERNQVNTGTTHTFSPDAVRAMSQYDWPGNVRELGSAIERACALTSGPTLHLADLPTQFQDFRMHGLAASNALDRKPGRILSMAELERQTIADTIRQVSGDKIMAARLLGIGKTTLYRKLKDYNITPTEISSH